jgi:pimeloyl-ACP methyl ester carboxylesterase
MTVCPNWRATRLTFEQGSLVDTGRVKLWFHDTEAEGEPVFYLGGWTAGHFQFDFVRPFMGGYRQLTWEPRGLGPSDRPNPAEHAYDLDVLSDDLRDLLDAVDVERAHLWAGGFASYHVLRFAARFPDRVGALVTYNDVWARDPLMAYDRIWNVYRTIVDEFGTNGIGARMLAAIFGVREPSWFAEWEAANIEEVTHPETVEALVGYGCLHADVRSDLTRIRAPTLVLRGEQGWDGLILDERRDDSLNLMRRTIKNVKVATVMDAHPSYAVVQRPAECAEIVQAFLARNPI